MSRNGAGRSESSSAGSGRQWTTRRPYGSHAFALRAVARAATPWGSRVNARKGRAPRPSERIEPIHLRRGDGEGRRQALQRGASAAEAAANASVVARCECMSLPRSGSDRGVTGVAARSRIARLNLPTRFEREVAHGEWSTAETERRRPWRSRRRPRSHRRLARTARSSTRTGSRCLQARRTASAGVGFRSPSTDAGCSLRGAGSGDVSVFAALLHSRLSRAHARSRAVRWTVHHWASRPHGDLVYVLAEAAAARHRASPGSG